MRTDTEQEPATHAAPNGAGGSDWGLVLTLSNVHWGVAGRDVELANQLLVPAPVESQ